MITYLIINIEYTYLLALLAALIVGFSKSGFKGLGFLVVTFMALAYGGKASTGILVPLLLIGDIMAIIYYRKDANWKVLGRLFPSMAVGVVIGTYVGDKISVETFKNIMAVIILFSGIMIAFMNKIIGDKVPDNWWFATVMGLGAGFTTMVGNLAGGFTNLYFLAMRFPKREFIGTAAWLFFFINIFKLPFHIWAWETINIDSLQENLYQAPFVLLGFVIGIPIIKKLSNDVFIKYIIFITILGALLILLK